MKRRRFDEPATMTMTCEKTTKDWLVGKSREVELTISDIVERAILEYKAKLENTGE